MGNKEKIPLVPCLLLPCGPYSETRSALCPLHSRARGSLAARGSPRWLTLLPGRLGQPLTCGGRRHSSRPRAGDRAPAEGREKRVGRGGLHSLSDAPVSVLCRGTPVWPPGVPTRPSDRSLVLTLSARLSCCILFTFEDSNAISSMENI